jgi:hypothetical protein
MVGSDQNESKAKRKAHIIKKPINPAISSASVCMAVPSLVIRSSGRRYRQALAAVAWQRHGLLSFLRWRQSQLESAELRAKMGRYQ